MATQKTVNADGFDVRYQEVGEGPAVIVLHGAGGPKWSPALDILAKDHRVLLFELPGWGPDANEQSKSMGDMAGTVAAIIDALRLAPAHVLGTSFGGVVALHLALDHADKVTSIVLESPAAFRVGSRPPNTLPPDEFVKAFRRHPEREPNFEPPDPEVMARAWPVVERLLVATPEYDEALVERMQSCTVRTLVLFGEFDGVIPAENGRTYRRYMSNCSFQIVHDAAHDIQGDRPEAFADVVGDFLRRGMAFLVPEQDTLINP